MTATITGPDGRAYLHSSARLEPVFVADQPGMRPANYAAHTGFAQLVAYLDPIQPGADRLATVRLPGGQTIQVRATALCPAAGLAPRRILPRADATRRLA
jgi:hypothetical protein